MLFLIIMAFKTRICFIAAWKDRQRVLLSAKIKMFAFNLCNLKILTNFKVSFRFWVCACLDDFYKFFTFLFNISNLCYAFRNIIINISFFCINLINCIFWLIIKLQCEINFCWSHC